MPVPDLFRICAESLRAALGPLLIVPQKPSRVSSGRDMRQRIPQSKAIYGY